MAEENANTTEKKGSGFDFSKTLKDTFDTIKAVFVKPNTKAIEKTKAVNSALYVIYSSYNPTLLLREFCSDCGLQTSSFRDEGSMKLSG